MKAYKKRRVFGLVLLSCFLIVAGTGAVAGEALRVVVLPFSVHASKDLSFLREGIVDMLTSRLSSQDCVVVSRKDTLQVLGDLSGPVNEETARAVGGKLGADYVLFGSLTVLGSSTSLDGKMVDVHQKRPTLTFFKQGKGLDDVIPQIDFLATEINQKVFGRSAVVQELAPSGEQRDIYAHPENLLAPKDQKKVSGEKPPARVATPSTVAQAHTVPEAFWKSRNFDVSIKGMALGDVDGDGKVETVFITDRHLYVYRFEKKRFLKIKEITGKRSQRFVGVDVADINANANAEIFVTSVKGTSQSLDSFVLEWADDDLSRISEHDSWYYRAIDSSEGNRVLLGQKRKMGKPFVPGVYRLGWRDGKYSQEERLTSLRGINLFGFALGDVINRGESMIVAFDESDHVRVFSLSGEEQWMSAERYGGSTNYLEFSLYSSGGDKDHLYLPQRILVRDLDGDGKHEVIMASNQGSMGRLFARYRKFTSSHIVCFTWKGLGLITTWQTPKVSGYISDCAVGDFDNDGDEDILTAVVAATGTAFSAARSAIMAYELTQPGSRQ